MLWMTLREAEAGILSSTTISSLGWWDFTHRGGGINAVMGAFGGFLLLYFVTASWVQFRSKDPPD